MSDGDRGHALAFVRRTTGADDVGEVRRLRSLWSGYGEILKVQLLGATVRSCVVKRVAPPSRASHPRGWSGRRSHERKLRSYDVELAWYRRHAARCGEGVRVPGCLGAERTGDGWLFVLEDLDAAGFSARRDALGAAELQRCLGWLARFHARFLGTTPEGLWEVGTYWHLATRPDELAAMGDQPLRDAASALDEKLRRCRFQTLVHGDAKVENFCFTPKGDRVAVVDFQYVGGGCGMKDVAYFLSSCLSADECALRERELLDAYFGVLRTELGARMPEGQIAALVDEWRALYPVAWADFNRFLAGWAPGHYKRHHYCDALTARALAEL